MDKQGDDKFMLGNEASFKPATQLNIPRGYEEHSLTISTGTQTTKRDFLKALKTPTWFELPKASDHDDPVLKVACDKVRIIQENLRQHVDFVTEHCINSFQNLNISRASNNESVPLSTPNNLPENYIITPPDSNDNMQIEQQLSSTSRNRFFYINNPLFGAIVQHELRIYRQANTSADSNRLYEVQNPEITESNLNETQVVCESELNTTYTVQDVACTVNVVTEDRNETPLSASTPYEQTDSSTIPSNVWTLPNKNTDLMIWIGPNKTYVRADVYNALNRSSYSCATRRLLMAVFDRKTLATHSMTGKPSPAFKDRNCPVKGKLDPLKIQDIIFAVKRMSGVSERLIRNVITTKCADENKMLKVRMKKKTQVNNQN